MSTQRKLYFWLILALGSGLLLAIQLKAKESKNQSVAVLSSNSTVPTLSYKNKLKTAREFCRKNGYNQQICFLVDMNLPSGSNRFFVYDLINDTILTKGLVAHGRCNKLYLEGRQYGNTVGCGCTSLGKYKIGGSYTGRFGKAYKLYGLENTNDKAFERYVVLHSYSEVPDIETPNEICQSDGCPMVSKTFLTTLASYLDHSKKPILLWLF